MLTFWTICFVLNFLVILIWWIKNGSSVKIDSVLFIKFILLFMMGPIALLFVILMFVFSHVDKIFEKLNISISPDKVKNLFK